jgi:hypothetical protein
MLGSFVHSYSDIPRLIYVCTRQTPRHANHDSPSVAEPVLRSVLLQLIQMLQPRQHHLFARLLDLAGQEHLIQDSVDLFIRH